MYRIQLRNGMYFLREHPAQARSWKNEEVVRIMNRNDVRTVDGGHVRAWDADKRNEE